MNSLRNVTSSLFKQIVQSKTIFQRASSNAGHASAATINWRRRIELATAYRALDKLGYNEGVCNHLTAMTPSQDGSQELMLVVSYGTQWSEVTPSSLLGISKDIKVIEGNGKPEMSALCIHRGVRLHVPHLAVMHLHTPYATALGILEDNRLLQLHQNSIRFYDKIVYDRFDGFGDSVVEGNRLGEELGDKNIMIMGNHGILAAYHSVAMAFDCIYYLERVAQLQILAMSTGQTLHEISKTIVEKTLPEWHQAEDWSAQAHFQSYIRYFSKIDDEFKEYDDYRN